MSEVKIENNYCYVKVIDDGADEAMEIPSEDSGALLLTTIQAQFPGCTGLRYRADNSNSWRGIRLSNGSLFPPPEGWGPSTFYVVYPKAADVSTKRKIDESPSNKEPEAKIVKTYGAQEEFGTQEEPLGDLIVLGLPFSCDEDDMKKYFQKFGEVLLVEVKKNPGTEKSKGFGFVSFKSNDVAREVLRVNHSIGGRRCEVKLPRQKANESPNVPMKVFVGRLAENTSEEDLKTYFGTYGTLKDVYIPKPFRGFGFVTFPNSLCCKDVVGGVHIINGSRVNTAHAEPRGQKETPNFQNMMHMFGNMSSKGGMNMFSQYYHPNNNHGGGGGGNNASHQQHHAYNRNQQRYPIPDNRGVTGNYQGNTNRQMRYGDGSVSPRRYDYSYDENNSAQHNNNHWS